MPGLLRGVARVAVAAGTATAVSNRVSRRQANKWSQEQGPPQEAAPPEPAYAEPPPPDPIERLKQLGQLHEQGVLTDSEFAAEKAKVLAS